MGYATFGQLLQWIERPAQKQVAKHRRELVNLANQARQELYSMYSELKLGINVEECFEVQNFCLDCHNCCSSYTGITLTAEMDGVEAIYVSSDPVRYFSRWREQVTGIRCGSQCHFEAVDQGQVFPFEVDASCCSGKCIAFRPEFAEDNNKPVTIRYSDSTDREHHEKLLLREGQWMKTNYPVKKLALPGAVVLPQLCGPVVVAVIDGDEFREISRYAPWETVPAYSRVKIHGVKPGDRVRVLANRRYHRLYFDDEIIESDNERVWSNLVNYLLMHDQKTDNPNQMNIARGYLADAKRLLVGDKSRTAGGLQENKLVNRPRNIRRSRLWTRR